MSRNKSNKKSNQLSKTQFLLLFFMALTTIAIIVFGVYLVMRSVPSSSILPTQVSSVNTKVNLLTETPRKTTISPTPENRPTQTRTKTPTPTRNLIEFTEFQVSPEVIQEGECVQITWEINGVFDKLQIYQNDQTIHESIDRTGTLQFCPRDSGNLPFHLTIKNQGQEINSPIIDIQILPATPIPANSLLGDWNLVFYLEETEGYRTILSSTIISLSFSIEGNLNGFAGCNEFNAKYSELDNSLVINSITTSKKNCESLFGTMEQENEFLALLEQANRYLVDRGVLELYDGEDRKILIFMR